MTKLILGRNEVNLNLLISYNLDMFSVGKKKKFDW